jgi:uncharacterized membrane protein
MIIKIKLFLINHYRIIMLALLMGIILSLPQYIDKSTKPGFQGISMGVMKDVGFYMARARDVIDGHPYLTNPYLYEHKIGAPMQFWIPDYILAKPIQWLGLSIPDGFILWTFVLGTLLALLSYMILFVLTKSKEWSLLGMALLHFGLYGIKFLRLPSPALVFVIWMATLLFLLLYINKKENKYVVTSAISFGMLFNVYTYYWTFYVVVFVVFIALSLLLRLKDISYKKYFLIFSGGLIVGIPYFFSSWQSLALPGYGESLARLGMIHTYFPSGIDSVFVASVVAIIFIILYFKKFVTINEQNVFLFSGVLSAAIVINQHLITGKNLEFSSHYMLGNMFWCAFVVTCLLVLWLKNKSHKIQKVILILSVIVVSIMSLQGAIGIIKQQIGYSPSEIYVQNYASVFDWLNKNAKLDDVVFANEDLNNYIPIYTSQNVYFSGLAILSFMTNEEVKNRFIINHYFDDFTDGYIRLMQRNIFGGFYVNEYGHNLSKNKLRKLFGLPLVAYQMVPDLEIQKIKLLAQTIQKNSFEKELKTYRVDYLIWDSAKDPNWKVKDLKFLKQVYSSNGIIIYKIN